MIENDAVLGHFLPAVRAQKKPPECLAAWEVETSGIEPPTSALRTLRSPS